MPDVERQLSILRDELRAAVPEPDLGAVVERHRQRRTRRRMQIGAVAAVLAVSGVVPILRQLDVEPPPATPPAPPTVTTLPATGGTPFISQMSFVDEDSGYALRCEGLEGDDPPPCQLTLLATDDLESWVEAGPVPVPERTDIDHLGRLIVLGPDELVVDWANLGEQTSSASARVHSDDGGRTWRNVPVPAVVTDAVPAIPEGAQLQRACATSAPYSCSTPTFTFALPGSGAAAVLADPPPLANPVPGEIPTADGHWWALGHVPGTARWAFSVSTDDGRTWTTTPLDADLPQNLWASVVSQGGILYASVSGADPLGDNELQAILRSEDDGRTWRQTWKLAEGEDLVQSVGTLVAAADGTVSFDEFPWTYTSTDGARTFELDGRERLGPVSWTRAGYLALGDRSGEFSPDGVDWRQFEIPLE